MKTLKNIKELFDLPEFNDANWRDLNLLPDRVLYRLTVDLSGDIYVWIEGDIPEADHLCQEWVGGQDETILHIGYIPDDDDRTLNWTKMIYKIDPDYVEIKDAAEEISTVISKSVLKNTLEDVIVSIDRDERKITRLQAKVAERTLYKEFLENKIKEME